MEEAVALHWLRLGKMESVAVRHGGRKCKMEAYETDVG